MKPAAIAVDTSIAVPLLSRAHALHNAASEWARGRSIVLCGHAAVETYSVLTRLPGAGVVSAADAARLLSESVDNVMPFTTSADVMALLAERGVAGGATYDGIVALAASEHGLTLATRDHRALATYDALGVSTQVISWPESREGQLGVR